MCLLCLDHTPFSKPLLSERTRRSLKARVLNFGCKLPRLCPRDQRPSHLWLALCSSLCQPSTSRTLPHVTGPGAVRRTPLFVHLFAPASLISQCLHLQVFFVIFVASTGRVCCAGHVHRDPQGSVQPDAHEQKRLRSPTPHHGPSCKWGMRPPTFDLASCIWYVQMASHSLRG